jgi:hypothetical protein
MDIITIAFSLATTTGLVLLLYSLLSFFELKDGKRAPLRTFATTATAGLPLAAMAGPVTVDRVPSTHNPGNNPLFHAFIFQVLSYSDTVSSNQYSSTVVLIAGGA